MGNRTDRRIYNMMDHIRIIREIIYELTLEEIGITSDDKKYIKEQLKAAFEDSVKLKIRRKYNAESKEDIK